MKTSLNRMGRIRLFPLLFQNGCSQSSRFLPQARRIVGSEDENVTAQTNPHATSILVPSATRLKMSLTSSPGRTKKFEFFHWLTKNGCAAEMKITKLYAFFNFYFRPWVSTFACALYEKKTNKWRPFPIDPKESQRFPRNHQNSILLATMSFSIVIIAF